MELPKISSQQNTIIKYHYKFRVLESSQLQYFLKHTTRRHTNELIKKLVTKNYLKQRKRNDIHKPQKTFLSLNGIRFLKTQHFVDKTFLKKLYHEDKLSDSFADKLCLIADVCITLDKKYKGTNETLAFYTQHDIPKDWDIKELNPDFAYTLSTKRKTKSHTCCVIEKTLPKNRIYGRVRKYLDHFVEDEEEHIIVICPTEDYQRTARRVVRRLIEEMGIGDLKIHVTTWETMRNGDIGERIQIFE